MSSRVRKQVRQKSIYKEASTDEDNAEPRKRAKKSRSRASKEDQDYSGVEEADVVDDAMSSCSEDSEGRVKRGAKPKKIRRVSSAETSKDFIDADSKKIVSAPAEFSAEKVTKRIRKIQEYEAQKLFAALRHLQSFEFPYGPRRLLEHIPFAQTINVLSAADYTQGLATMGLKFAVLPVGLHDRVEDLVIDDIFQQQVPLLEARTLSDHGVGSAREFPAANASAEVLLSAGGPVWALDWARLPPNHTTQYLAVGAHPAAEPTHVIGETFCGKNVIQIWAIGSGMGSSHGAGASCEGGAAVGAQLVLAIAHDASFAWDVRWNPFPSSLAIPPTSNSSSASRLGVLAAALGDGKVHVLSVPHPSLIPSSTPGGEGWRGEGVVVASDTICVFGVPDAVIWSVDWSVHNPDRIAVAATDGTVAVWLIDTTGTCSCVMQVRAHTQPARRVMFCPHDAHLLASCGYDGYVRIWDTRDPVAPLYSHFYVRGWHVDGVWPCGWPSVVTVMDDPFVRVVDLRECATKSLTLHQSHLWAVAVSAVDARLVSSGSDGRVVSYSLGGTVLKVHHVHERPVLRIAARASWSPALGALLLSDRPQPHFIYPGSIDPYASTKREHDASLGELTNRDKLGPRMHFPPLEQCVTRLSWNPNVQGCRWLAVGMHAGYVRCLWF